MLCALQFVCSGNNNWQKRQAISMPVGFVLNVFIDLSDSGHTVGYKTNLAPG